MRANEKRNPTEAPNVSGIRTRAGKEGEALWRRNRSPLRRTSKGQCTSERPARSRTAVAVGPSRARSKLSRSVCLRLVRGLKEFLRERNRLRRPPDVVDCLPLYAKQWFCSGRPRVRRLFAGATSIFMRGMSERPFIQPPSACRPRQRGYLDEGRGASSGTHLIIFSHDEIVRLSPFT
jgi:hypothetical protein